MGMLKGILVLIIGILLILEQISSIAAILSGMYINWIIAILVLIIGIVMLMKKK